MKLTVKEALALKGNWAKGFETNSKNFKSRIEAIGAASSFALKRESSDWSYLSEHAKLIQSAFLHFGVKVEGDNQELVLILQTRGNPGFPNAEPKEDHENDFFLLETFAERAIEVDSLIQRGKNSPEVAEYQASGDRKGPVEVSRRAAGLMKAGWQERKQFSQADFEVNFRNGKELVRCFDGGEMLKDRLIGDALSASSDIYFHLGLGIPQQETGIAPMLPKSRIVIEFDRGTASRSSEDSDSSDFIEFLNPCPPC